MYYGGDRNNYIDLPVAITSGLVAEKIDDAVARHNNLHAEK